MAYILAGFTSRIAQSTSSHATASGSRSISNMVATLRVPLVFPVETCFESTKAIHSPRSGLKIGDHYVRTMSAYVPLRELLYPGHPVAMLSLVPHPANPMLNPTYKRESLRKFFFFLYI